MPKTPELSGVQPFVPVDTTPALKSLWVTWPPPPPPPRTLKIDLMQELYHTKSIIMFLNDHDDRLIFLWKMIIEIQYTTIHGQNNHNPSPGFIHLFTKLYWNRGNNSNFKVLFRLSSHPRTNLATPVTATPCSHTQLRQHRRQHRSAAVAIHCGLKAVCNWTVSHVKAYYHRSICAILVVISI